MRRLLLPTVIVAALIGAWQAAASSGFQADVLNLEDFLVPAPSEIAQSLWQDRSLLADNAWVTLQEVLLGFGIGPKLAIIALICFFPITVNALDGLRSVDPDAVKMMRTLDANRWAIFKRVEAPTALPFAFSGAKIAVAVAVIGAVFGEWSGSSSGLGWLIQNANNGLQTARLFAAIVVLSAMAIILFGLLALLERKVVRWR